MPSLIIQTPRRTWESALPQTALVGRHPSCAIVIDQPEVPAHWLELRWTGSMWVWRPLAGLDQTTGSGELLKGGWRRWRVTGGPVGTGVRIGEVRLRLVEPDAPEPVLEWLEEGLCTPLADSALALQPTPTGELLTIPDTESVPRKVASGSVLAVEGRPARLWIPDGWTTTASPTVSIDAPDLLLDFGADPCEVTLTVGRASVELRSEEVRLLRVYAEARCEDARDAHAGYRSTAAAFDRWVELGGKADSSLERLSWMRHRLRSQLESLGVAAAGELFERRRVGTRWSHRLSLEPDTLVLPAS